MNIFVVASNAAEADDDADLARGVRSRRVARITASSLFCFFVDPISYIVQPLRFLFSKSPFPTLFSLSVDVVEIPRIDFNGIKQPFFSLSRNLITLNII
jgi:hypothetical protein